MTIQKPLPRCPVEVTLSLIDERWKVLILRELLFGTRRFGEIRKSLGNISTKVLTANLRSMEESGLLTRKVYPEVPPRVEYTLTELGFSLKDILSVMVEWGSNYKRIVEGQVPVRMEDGSIFLMMKAVLGDLGEISGLFASSCKKTLSEDEIAFVGRLVETGACLKAVDEQNKIMGIFLETSGSGFPEVPRAAVVPAYAGQGLEEKMAEEIRRP